MNTVRDSVHGLLRQLDLTTVFGNPGSTEQPFLKHFPDDFRYVLGLQEASVVAMADGYAQGTGRPALVNLHTIGGTGHAVGNLICAYYNKTPLVVTAGQQTREMLLLEPYLSHPRATETVLPWVKWSYEPVRAADVPAALMRAYATAVQPPAGPVFVSLPYDDMEELAEGSPVVRTLGERVGPDPARLEDFARRIDAAHDPVLVLGGSVERAGGWDAGLRLAEKLNAPVWAPPETERAAFPEDHPLFRGFLPFAVAPLCERLRGHDVVVVVGAPVFRYYPYVPGDYLPPGTSLLHLTEDPAESARAPVGDSLLADPRLALEALLTLVEPGPTAPVPARDGSPRRPSSSSGELTPSGVFATVQDVRPDDTVFVVESTSNVALFHEQVPITRPGSFYLFGSGGLGWGLPAAVGHALAERATGRDRPVLAVLGDGAANYSIQALYTAAQERLPIVFLVLVNREYAILKAFADHQDTPGVPGLDLPGLDFVSLAEGYGCVARSVATVETLAEELRAALGRPGPTVLAVSITADVPPLL